MSVEDSGTTWRSYPGAPNAVLSGGLAITASSLSAVSDPSILAQLPAAARASVQQLNLTALGVTDLGGPLPCRAYMGGDACILPGNIVPTPVELFWLGDSSTPDLDAAPLTLARYPNRDVAPMGWATVAAIASGSNGRTVLLDSATAARMPAWSSQFSSRPGSFAVHYGNPIGWADMHLTVDGITAPSATTTGTTGGAASAGGSNASLTLAICGDPANYNTLDVGGYLYAYNLLSELDAPGEYYVDFVTGMAYVWPPTPGDKGEGSFWWGTEWGMPRLPAERTDGPAGASSQPPAPGIVGYASMVGDLLQLEPGTQGVTFSGITFTVARGAIVAAEGAVGVIFDGCILQNGGAMGVNVTGGQGVVIHNSTVRNNGNGGVWLYAGDRDTLTPSGHLVNRSAVTVNNRYMFDYTPLVALADCGNTLLDSEVWGAPHQGIFVSGNDHSVVGSTIHDVVQVVADSGALYTGRDWTYRGNVVANNTFHTIHSVLGHDDVSAVYLDDSASGWRITGNSFVNVSRALLLGGGRDNLFVDNSVTGYTGAHGTNAGLHFDDRDLGWSKGSCAVGNATVPQGVLVRFLLRVPFNSSAAWISAYPDLPSILDDEPCVPKYNAIALNTLCGGSYNGAQVPWLDVTNSSLASWGSTEWGNINAISC